MRLRLMCLIGLTAAMITVGAQSGFAATVTVDVANFSFSPRNVTIQQGDIIRWEWVSGSHTTTSGTGCSSNGLWNASINFSNQSFQRQFNSPGSFPYFCLPHCGSGMNGTITVEMNTSVFDRETGRTSVPGSFDVAQNYPNPFNAATVIRYTLERVSNVELDIYDVLGRRLTTLVDGEQEIGAHEATWDGTDGHGAAVSSGIYFYRLNAGGEAVSRKMTLLK